MRLVLTAALLSALVFHDVVCSSGSSVDDFISARLTELDGLKFTEDQDYWPQSIYPPLKWNQQKGLYASYVHVNFHGEPGFTLLRNGYKFPDNNGFVTMFVLQALIESAELNSAIQISDFSLLDAVSAVVEHQDKNSEAGSPLYTFWNQRLNSLGNHYETYPENIGTPLSQGLNGFEMVTDILHTLHLDSLADQLAPLKDFFNVFFKDFRIPPDADDTGCNLALGMKLKQLARRFPLAQQKWASANTLFDVLISTLKKYHYSPFSDDNSVNTIDPRTYFWIRGFLEEQLQTQGANSNLSLVTTWFLSQAEVQAEFVSRGVSMPFQANNVDASVAANLLFGLTSAAINQEGFADLLVDDQIQNLIKGTADMLEWALRRDILQVRPDLTLLYYPPVYDFYWFVARIVHLLNSPPSGALNSDVLVYVRDKLTAAIQSYGTEQLLGKMEREGDYVHWDDFLGDADTIALISSPKHEDRVFSTCAALNALIDMWTISQYDQVTASKTLQWRSDAPQTVQDVIAAGAKWMLEKSMDFPAENVFFSGSMKSPTYSLPFYYPQNVLHDVITNVDYDCSANITFTGGSSWLVGVRGVYNETDYVGQLAGTCHGQSVPINYPGNNCDTCVFPYWSAPSLTKALQVLVMSKLKSLGVIEQI
eukprot:TRINITY_DN1428_c0_g1_i1.p1 TRINITY_DN1428_c0_g1~~TRINITY_DN1428_c0_g1_i1.p1  ORF type:complete len:650 (-),score=192.97 TRINITY_DN1428_c0_g1_i1:49-1998(-)